VQAGEANGDPNQPAGIGIRQRPKENGVENAKHRRTRADAERKRKYRRYSESPVLPQHAEAVTEIAEQRFQSRNAGPVAICLLRLLHAAEFQQSLAPRFFRRHARAEIVVDVQLQVGFDLRRDFALQTLFAKRTADTEQPRTQASHGWLPGAKKRAKTAIASVQSRVSCCARLQPARVRR
jgi:hypothetical protein